MPRIFDNINQKLLPILRATLQTAKRADFCVGYFNLRGWQAVDDLIAPWQPEHGQVCRVLVGMQRPPQADIHALYRQSTEGDEDALTGVDNATALRLQREFAAHLREQITLGIPTGQDEAGLRRLAQQLRGGQVVVRLFLPYPLHAKLYLLFREDQNNPATGFVGSSNLTVSGLSGQGELNVDVLDHQATDTLSRWFDERWHDRWALDVSKDLADIIETSWAREDLIPPFHIYLNIAYHLSAEARAGLSQFRLPARFEKELFDFQKSAVKIAARHLHKRGGVLIGDVVGLGKTIMATALARMFEDDMGYETLIICPKNLETMWEHYRSQYGLRGVVLPLSQVSKKLPDLKRYRLVLIDESHNLRNREGRRYKVISDYIQKMDAKVILLTATPYNKTKTDLSAQLRLFIDEKTNIGIRPEHYMRKMDMGETEFERKHQCSVHSILAIEKSDEFDDWRELIRLYMVRRTRSFILQHYTQTDKNDEKGRKYIIDNIGEKRYFPTRKPLSITFPVNENDSNDRYARLYSTHSVDAINTLRVPRYGLGLYIDPIAAKTASASEKKQIDNLGKAGKRLMGFCRTNLFKRLESSGYSFLQSIERHIARNKIYLYAIENKCDLPIGTLDISDDIYEDEDEDEENIIENFTESIYKNIYERYSTQYKNRFNWIDSRFFKKKLADELAADTQILTELLASQGGAWEAQKDHKLQAFLKLIQKTHAKDKVLIFTQFADTARYLAKEAHTAGIKYVEVATGSSSDPYTLACRFSPKSNGYKNKLQKGDEIRVLICTDVLSEGQNLQDCNVVVNFDLPWAIIRLIQRAGRVDRIGQQSEDIYCYSFLPSDGVENLIQLRSRIQKRLKENAEVVGTDESFFEGDDAHTIRDLYTEKQGILDDTDDEVDLASYAHAIWKHATQDNPQLAKKVENLPPVVYSSKATTQYQQQGGVLVYIKSPEGNDHLAWVNAKGERVTESQFTILRAAECEPNTPAIHRAENHHEGVAAGLQLAVEQDKSVGGGLGRPSSPRRKIYDRLKPYATELMKTLLRDVELERALDDIYQRPLLETASELLNRLMRGGVNDSELAEAIKSLREDNRLTYSEEENNLREPLVVCSMGLLCFH